MPTFTTNEITELPSELSGFAVYPIVSSPVGSDAAFEAIKAMEEDSDFARGQQEDRFDELKELAKNSGVSLAEMLILGPAAWVFSGSSEDVARAHTLAEHIERSTGFMLSRVARTDAATAALLYWVKYASPEARSKYAPEVTRQANALGVVEGVLKRDIEFAEKMAEIVPELVETVENANKLLGFIGENIKAILSAIAEGLQSLGEIIPKVLPKVPWGKIAAVGIGGVVLVAVASSAIRPK